MTNPQPAAAPSVGLPLEVRAVAVLLALEVVAGIWFALNWPPGMSLFLSQIPAIGAAGVVWGFLPDAPKKEFGEWFGAQLRRRRVWITTVVLLATTLLTSCFVNTVAVTGAPDSPTWIYLHSGQALRASAPELPIVDSLRLRRGAEHGYFWIWTSPLGRRVWLHSRSHLTPDERIARPWAPTSITYPDDFESPVVLAALPGTEAVEEITSPRPWRVVVLDVADGDTLAVDTLNSPGAALFAFIKTGTPPDSVAKWSGEAARLRGGADTVLLHLWSDSARSRYTRRPLRGSERVKIIAVDSLGKSVSTREVTLNNGLTTTLVAP